MKPITRVRLDLSDFVEDPYKYQWISFQKSSFKTVRSLTKYIISKFSLSKDIIMYLEEMPFTLPPHELSEIIQNGDLLILKRHKEGSLGDASSSSGDSPKRMKKPFKTQSSSSKKIVPKPKESSSSNSDSSEETELPPKNIPINKQLTLVPKTKMINESSSSDSEPSEKSNPLKKRKLAPETKMESSSSDSDSSSEESPQKPIPVHIVNESSSSSDSESSAEKKKDLPTRDLSSFKKPSPSETSSIIQLNDKPEDESNKIKTNVTNGYSEVSISHNKMKRNESFNEDPSSQSTPLQESGSINRKRRRRKKRNRNALPNHEKKSVYASSMCENISLPVTTSILPSSASLSKNGEDITCESMILEDEGDKTVSKLGLDQLVNGGCVFVGNRRNGIHFESLSSMDKSLEDFHSLQSLPKPGDVLVFKVLELSDSYTPVISKFKRAKVISFDGDNISLEKLESNDGEWKNQSCKLGKFDLGDDSILAEEENSVSHYKWKDLIDVRSKA